jgi:hypothetical protein
LDIELAQGSLPAEGRPEGIAGGVMRYPCKSWIHQGFVYLRLRCDPFKVLHRFLIPLLHRLITTETVLDDTPISVPRIDLFLTCGCFPQDPAPAKSPYRAKSSVAPEAIQGQFLDGTSGNSNDLASLCAESGFEDLCNAIARFLSSDYDKDGLPVHDPENVRTLFAELDSPIPLRGVSALGLIKRELSNAEAPLDFTSSNGQDRGHSP